MLVPAQGSENKEQYVSCDMIVDVVMAAIPMLLLREALRKMRGSIDFALNILKIDDKYLAKLGATKNGHLTMPFKPWVLELGHAQVIMLTKSEERHQQPEDTIMVADTHKEKLADKELIRKTHLHLAHLNRGGLMRLLSATGYHFELGDVSDVLGKCSRLSQNARIQKPFAAQYLP